MAVPKLPNPIPQQLKNANPEAANFIETTDVPGAAFYLAPLLQRATEPTMYPHRKQLAKDRLDTGIREIKSDPVGWTARNVVQPITQDMRNQAANGIPMPPNTYIGSDQLASDVASSQVQFLIKNNFDFDKLSPDIKQIAVPYKIYQQILDQGTIDKWTGMGYGSPKRNALEMAKSLAGVGITDIKQFGLLPDGGYGNKITGQAINPNYTRAGGNIWGGTFIGENSTGFGVQFAPNGTPYFYTQEGASTSDMGKIAPIVGLGLALFAPGIGGAIGSALTGTAATTVASQVIGSAIVQGTLAELSGGNFADAAITAAVTAGVAPVVAGSIGTSLSQAMSDSIFREVVVNATTSAAASAVAAAVTGKDVGESAIAGAVAGAASPVGRLAGGTIADAMGSSVLAETVANAVANATTSAISASILNKDISDAAFAGLVSGATSSIGRELGTAAEYGTTPYTEQNQILLAQEKGMGTSGSAGANLGSAAGAIALGADPFFSILNAVAKTGMESSLAKGTPVDQSRVSQSQVSQSEEVLAPTVATAEDQEPKILADALQSPTDSLVPGIDNIENIISGPSAQVAQSGDPSADLAIIDAISSDDKKSETSTVIAPDGSQLVYDQDDNLVDIIPAPEQLDLTPIERPDALIPDEDNPNLEPGKTPQQRADEEWQRYLDGLGTKPTELDLPGSTIDAGEYFDEYNKNLQSIMDEGGYTSQWQATNGDRVFISDDGTGIGINENGGTYALSDTEVESMVESGLLNTADSGYVKATGGEEVKPDGADQCGDGYHFDEARQLCVPDSDEEEDDECPEGYIRNLNTGECIRIDSQVNTTDPRVKTTVVTSNPSIFTNPGSRNPFFMPETPIFTSPSISDDPVMKGALSEMSKEAKFQGPLDQFLKIATGDSFTPKPPQPQPAQQQAGTMNDRLSYPQGGSDYFSYGQQSDIENNLDAQFGQAPTEQPMYGALSFKQGGMAAPLMAGGGTTRYGQYAGGGLNVINHSGKQRLDFRKGAAVTGPGDGQSDDIPAMLADGEFVFPADVVAALGNGSTKAGSDKLYEMMHSIRAHHRSAKPKDLPPPAKKSPLDYLKKAKKARS